MHGQTTRRGSPLPNRFERFDSAREVAAERRGAARESLRALAKSQPFENTQNREIADFVAQRFQRLARSRAKQNISFREVFLSFAKFLFRFGVGSSGIETARETMAPRATAKARVAPAARIASTHDAIRASCWFEIRPPRAPDTRARGAFRPDGREKIWKRRFFRNCQAPSIGTARGFGSVLMRV
jgi:hypothetical protein